MSDKIKNIHDRIKEIRNNKDTLHALLSYLPVFGWLIVSLTNKQNNENTSFHVKQAKELNIYIIVLFVFKWFLENFPITSWIFGENRFLNPLLSGLWSIILAFYVVLSLIGAYHALHEKQWSFPYRQKISEKIKEVMKGFFKDQLQ